MFLLAFFLCSCSPSSYVLARLLLTFSLAFFLCSRSPSSYVLACLLLMFSLAVPPRRLVVDTCRRLYTSLNQTSRRVIKQSGEAFLEVILRSSLADPFSAE